MTLAERFNTSIFMSGTPADYQKAIFNKNKTNTDCPLYEAIRNNWICKPELNLVKASANFMPSIIKEILAVEMAKSASDKFNFGVRILANMKSIDDCHSCVEALKSQEEFKNVHTIIIHSKKKIIDDNEEKGYKFLESEIDGTVFANEKTIEKFTEIDKGEKFANEPIIVFQVDMLSEGVNIKCFNAVIVQSGSSVKQMQQIGRVLRNITITDKNGVEHKKIEEGHASIYAIIEIETDIIDLLTNLSEYGLTEDCFKWGRLLVERTGGSEDNADDDEGSEEGGLTWEEIGEVKINEYKISWGSNNAQREIKKVTGVNSVISDEMFSKMEAFLSEKSKSGDIFTSATKAAASKRDKAKNAHEKSLEKIKEKREEKEKKIEEKITKATEVGNTTEVEKLQKEKVKVIEEAKKEERKENNKYNMAGRRILQKFYAYINNYLNRSTRQDIVRQKDRKIWLNNVFQGNSDFTDFWMDLTEKYPEIKEKYFVK